MPALPNSICADCLEDITSSKGYVRLPQCDHAFCVRCSERRLSEADPSPTNTTESVMCPLCGTHIKVFVLRDCVHVAKKSMAQKNASSASDDATTHHAVEHSSSPQRPTATVPCDFCEAEVPSTKAVSCDSGCGVLCAACKDTTHSRGRFKTHTVTPLERDDGKPKLGKCSTHVKPLEVYCYDCDDYICLLCHQFGVHVTHKAAALSDALHEAEVNLAASTQRVQAYQEQLRAGMSKIEATETEACNEYDRQVANVKSHFDFLKQQMLERENNILAELRAVRDHKSSVLHAQAAHIKREMEHTEFAIDSVTSRKNFIASFQLVQECGTLTQRLDAESNIIVPVVPKENSLYACFMEKGAARDAAHIRQLGMIDPSPKSSGELFTYSHDFDTNGILHWIGRNYGTRAEYQNPAALGLVTVTASSTEFGDAANAVGHAHHQPKYATFSTKNEPGAWVCLHFGAEYVVCPTTYTLRNCVSTIGHSMHNWVLEGSCDGVDWTVLSQHINDTTMNSDRASVASYSVTEDFSRGFNRIRIRLTGPNRYVSVNAQYHYLMLSGMELYGYVTRSIHIKA